MELLVSSAGPGVAQRPASGRRVRRSLSVAAGLLWLLAFAAFGLPLHTLDWSRDLFVFFGQINALEHDQIPYRDFRTSMGALPFFLPWLGYRIAGGFGGAMEIAGLLAAALLLPCFVGALHRRFSLLVGTVLLAALTTMVAVPVGEGLQSHIGFYNRWCSAALAALFLLAAPPLPPSPRGSASASVEGAAVAVLLLFLFFTKATYFAVGFMFVIGFGAVFGLFRRVALVGVAATVTTVAGTQFATGLVDDYVAELAHSVNVSGASWYAREKFLHRFLPALAPYYGALAVACMVSPADFGWRRWLFLLYASSSCLALQGHDANFVAPLPLVAALALLCAQIGERGWRRSCRGLLLTLCTLPVLVPAVRLGLDKTSSMPATPSELPRMAGVSIYDIADDQSHLLRFVEDQVGPGLRLLEEHRIGDGVLALDYYNWFPAFLRTAPLPERLAVLMPGRTLDRDSAPPAEEMFRHARYVMVPNERTDDRSFLLALYGEYFYGHYQLQDGNDRWQLWAVGTGRPEALSQALQPVTPLRARRVVEVP